MNCTVNKVNKINKSKAITVHAQARNIIISAANKYYLEQHVAG